jgi:septal ring factor EnvC (AmiA/AmiB activator)
VSGTGFAALRGRLGWPVAGKVVGDYGAQIHPRFGTKTFRHGIDIGVPEGTRIVAVAPGHVLYTGWFRGYGNLIILDHGGEYYTLYAHAADIRVTEGDEIRQGQVIGAVGDTGSLEGARLYFEVRHQGRPQDPTQWLVPRG